MPLVGYAYPLGDGAVDALFVSVHLGLALGGVDHGLQDTLPADLCVGEAGLGLAEALDVFAPRAPLSELVLPQRLKGDLHAPGVTG